MAGTTKFSLCSLAIKLFEMGDEVVLVVGLLTTEVAVLAATGEVLTIDKSDKFCCCEGLLS